MDFLLNENLIDITAKVSPTILAKILNCDSSLLYYEEKKGALPLNFSKQYNYIDCITHIVNYYKNKEESKLKQIEINSKKQSLNKGIDLDGKSLEIAELTAKKIASGIKLDEARTKSITQKLQIERGQYLDKQEIINLLTPFLSIIKDELVSASLDNPDLIPIVDKTLQALYDVGKQLILEANEDEIDLIEELSLTPDITLIAME